MSTPDLAVLRSATTPKGRSFDFYSLPALKEAGFANIDRLPVSIRIVLESLLRNFDERQVTRQHIADLASWQPNAPRCTEIPFKIARILLQDFTGVPLLCDLASMRTTAKTLNCDVKKIEPLVNVDLVVDHSVQIDAFGSKDALCINMDMEFKRNHERYQFMKWGMQAFEKLKVVPPGIGICHQVNLEFLARGVHRKDSLCYFDSLVGTDSHTTMINGIGVVGWGVGGIEAEAGMLGQPINFLTPDVVGVELKGQLKPGVTTTDLVLRVTEMLRDAKVVGKFVEYFGEGAARLPVPDRATLANMAPEYGATMGFFTVDEKTLDYFSYTNRTEEERDYLEGYFKAQGVFGIPQADEIDYSTVLTLDLSGIEPSVAGPKRPQDRILVSELKETVCQLLTKAVKEGGFNQGNMNQRFNLPDGYGDIGHGDIAIAAITSCTNTSNPGVLVAAGILAKKAVAKGLSVNKKVKTSFAPGSRVVPDYLKKAGLMDALNQLGFEVAAFGCTTCIGNSGPLAEPIEKAIVDNHLVAAAVLSGNRNFEARIHQNVHANFLASPPLVVAYAISGTVLTDLNKDALGHDQQGNPVYLKDIWPTDDEISEALSFANDPQLYSQAYDDLTKDQNLWNAIETTTGQTYGWPESTYIANPPFFDEFCMTACTIEPIKNARILALFGDSVTTDHISPAGAIKASTPAGLWLKAHGVNAIDFNSYGARRGHHDVMVRGTFANTRIKNLMIPPKEDGQRVEGGFTLQQPDDSMVSIYEAAVHYQEAKTPTVIFAGEEYGTGSSRDWAAKGTCLLGVRAVIARSFERIHRSNLVGMGVLPLQFIGNDSIAALNLTGTEIIDLIGVENKLTPQQTIQMIIHRSNGESQTVGLLLRIDTPVEVDYYEQGGILPYVLRQLLASA